MIRANPGVTIYFPRDFFGAGGPLNFSVAGTDPDAKEQLPEDHRYFNGETDLAELRTDGRFYMVRQVAPAHFSGHLAFLVLREIYGDDYRFFGLGSVVAR